MYIACAVLPVNADNKNKYLEAAEWMANWSIEQGALEVMEAWEQEVPDGKVTDYRRAVAAKPDEKIVTGWVIWPDKETFDKANAAMMNGEGMPDEPHEMPFDGSRLIYGGFEPVLHRKK